MFCVYIFHGTSETIIVHIRKVGCIQMTLSLFKSNFKQKLLVQSFSSQNPWSFVFKFQINSMAVENPGGPRPLLCLQGALQWLPSNASTPIQPTINLVPRNGVPLPLCPDHLLATSPLLRQLLPTGLIDYYIIKIRSSY